MATYYVGIGGNDVNDGLTWANRKLTLNGAEDIPVAAGDTVYVGPGTYRELLTVDVSGSSGSPITYIGDYSGANTSGTSGVVRVTGAAANDQSATRANSINMSSKAYRTFRGFQMDVCTGSVIASANCTNIIIDECFIYCAPGQQPINISGASQATHTIQNCYIYNLSSYGINPVHTVAVDNTGHLIQNCILETANGWGILIQRVGGITIKNCTLKGGATGIYVFQALSAGQTITVNNCIINSGTGVSATAVGEITEDYNTFYCGTARANTNTGANSVTYPPIFDARWFFELTE